MVINSGIKSSKTIYKNSVFIEYDKKKNFISWNRCGNVFHGKIIISKLFWKIKVKTNIFIDSQFGSNELFYNFLWEFKYLLQI